MPDLTFDEWLDEYDVAFQFRSWDTVAELQDAYPEYLDRLRAWEDDDDDDIEAMWLLQSEAMALDVLDVSDVNPDPESGIVPGQGPVSDTGQNVVDTGRAPV